MTIWVSTLVLGSELFANILQLEAYQVKVIMIKNKSNMDTCVCTNVVRPLRHSP